MKSIYTKFNIPNFQGCSFLCMLLWRGFFCTRIKLVAPTRLQLRAGMDVTSQYFDTPPLEFGKIAIGSHWIHFSFTSFSLILAQLTYTFSTFLLFFLEAAAAVFNISHTKFDLRLLIKKILQSVVVVFFIIAFLLSCCVHFLSLTWENKSKLFWVNLDVHSIEWKGNLRNRSQLCQNFRVFLQPPLIRKAPAAFMKYPEEVIPSPVWSYLSKIVLIFFLFSGVFFFTNSALHFIPFLRMA